MNFALKDHYHTEYDSIATSLPGNRLPWMKEARERALSRFSESGFPSPREEEWRYTNVAAIERKLFSARRGAVRAFDPKQLSPFHIEGTHALVFVDGHFSPECSALPEPVSGLIVCSMNEAFETHVDLLVDSFSKILDAQSNSFLTFNTALFTDGAFVFIPKNLRLECPLHLLFVSTAADGLATTRNLLVAQAGSQAEIIESHVGLGESGYLNASVTELAIAEDARIGWSKFQCENRRGFHFGGLYARLDRGAHLRHANFSFGGLLVRNEVHVDQLEASESTLDGLYLCTERQHVDNHTRIRHRECHGKSREFYKGILDQRARGVFQGRIIVEQDAQKTDAMLSNRNLLLSNDAEIDTKPQLEIYADDVKCAHGVTVGQLDEKSIFYLQSRGIDVESARSMLTFAFANEMVDQIKFQPLRSLIQSELLACLPLSELRKEWL